MTSKVSGKTEISTESTPYRSETPENIEATTTIWVNDYDIVMNPYNPADFVEISQRGLLPIFPKCNLLVTLCTFA